MSSPGIQIGKMKGEEHQYSAVQLSKLISLYMQPEWSLTAEVTGTFHSACDDQMRFDEG